MSKASLSSTIYPLTFHPTFKDYTWGGRNLETKLGRGIPEGIVAESWEIAGHPNGSSIVKNGELAGMTLPQVQEQLGVDLVGNRNQFALDHNRFPLLIKLLDANRWLSVQVHPDDEYGLANEGEFGKTEMWIVLHAEPESEIIFGFKPNVDRESFAQAIKEDRVEEMLHRMSVKPGDVVFVPAGAIHALGPGIIVAEIQQNSDTTYRIYDWGRPRPIHIEQALNVLDFDLVEPGPLEPTPLENNGIIQEQIGLCEYFCTERLHLPAGQKYSGACDGETFEILAVLEGSFSCDWAGASSPIQRAIGWTLLPAALGDYEIKALSDSLILRIFTPE